MTNEEFFTTYAAKGKVGLVGGTAFIDKSIRQLQKKITPDQNPSPFSHAFIFSGKREDGQFWIFESDLEFHRRHTKIGIQENRISKYYDVLHYPNVAVLDFNLSEEAIKRILAEALNLLSGKGEYSLREIFGVMLSLDKKTRTHSNLFSRDNSFFCSAFVQHCYVKADTLFNEKVSLKHLTPSDIYCTEIPHQSHTLIREKF